MKLGRYTDTRSLERDGDSGSGFVVYMSISMSLV